MAAPLSGMGVVSGGRERDAVGVDLDLDCQSPDGYFGNGGCFGTGCMLYWSELLYCYD